MLNPIQQHDVQVFRELAEHFEARGYPVTALLFRNEAWLIENEQDEKPCVRLS